MKRIFLTVWLIVMVLATAYGLEWPVDAPVFLRFFGQRVADTGFEQGIVFENPSVVRAADSGNVLIALKKKYAVRNFPSTLGNALIFLHDDGLQTIYANIEIDDHFQDRKQIEIGSIIGKTDPSAWDIGRSLQFQVIDAQKKAYINPLLLFPTVPDSIKPHIQGIFLANADNQLISLDKQKHIAQGNYTIYTAVFDTIDHDAVHQFTPFRVTVFVNGSNIWTVPFETITYHSGQLFLSTTSFSDALLYQKQGLMYIGKVTLNSGKSDIMIIARDITGNESTERISLQIE
ncbi:MAG: peptidoglycan DD-metalloendopeptidase family protein [Treponema sp.]